MKIAVVGAGISGLGASYVLQQGHDVTLLEGGSRFGGHSNTVDVSSCVSASKAPIATVGLRLSRPFVLYFARRTSELTAKLNVRIGREIFLTFCKPESWNFSAKSEVN